MMCLALGAHRAAPAVRRLPGHTRRGVPTRRSSPVCLSVGVALALALTTACADHATPTAPAGPSITAPPDHASADGATIDRSLFPYGFLGGGDPRDGLRFFAGPVDPVAAVALKCPDASVIAPISPGARTQTVTTPSGRIQVGAYNQQTHIAVWQYGAGLVTDPCQLVGAPVVATGVVQYKLEIANDGGAGTGAFVLHVNAVGVVDLTSGGQARLHATARILIRPDGTLQFDEERVSLTPI